MAVSAPSREFVQFATYYFPMEPFNRQPLHYHSYNVHTSESACHCLEAPKSQKITVLMGGEVVKVRIHQIDGRSILVSAKVLAQLTAAPGHRLFLEVIQHHTFQAGFVTPTRPEMSGEEALGEGHACLFDRLLPGRRYLIKITVV